MHIVHMLCNSMTQTENYVSVELAFCASLLFALHYQDAISLDMSPAWLNALV